MRYRTPWPLAVLVGITAARPPASANRASTREAATAALARDPDDALLAGAPTMAAVVWQRSLGS